MSDNKDLIAAKDILSQCNFTKLGTKTTEHPFFSPIKEEFTTIENVIKQSSKDNTDIIDLANEIDLPQNYIIYIYCLTQIKGNSHMIHLVFSQSKRSLNVIIILKR